MKKFIYGINGFLILLLPIIVLSSDYDDTIRYKTTTAFQTKMVKTTVFLDRSSNKETVVEDSKEEEVVEEEHEEEDIETLEKEEKEKQAVAAKKITPVQAEEVVSSRASGDNNASNLNQNISVVANSQKRVFVGAKFYNRKISSYGTDCCSSNSYSEEDKLLRWDSLGLGVTASGYRLQYKNIYFNAGSYGNVRIVAADHYGQYDFPLTTIVKVTEKMNNGSYQSFNAIVLDRGDKNIGLDSKYIFDLVSESQATARKFGVHSDIEVEVLKLGTSEDLSSVRRFGHL